MTELLAGVVKARDEVTASRKPKLVLKIAPDLTDDEVTDIAAAVRSSGIDGVIVSNTTIRRPPGLTERTCLYLLLHTLPRLISMQQTSMRWAAFLVSL